MTYFGPIAQEAAYLSELTGLNPLTAQAWLMNEGQSDSIATPSNPLNIVVAGGGSGTGTETGHNGPLYTYADWRAGIRAAAHLVNSSSHYAGIRAAIASGSAYDQARAIERSPWAGGGYGTKHAAGVAGGVARTTARLSGLAGPVDSGAQVAQSVPARTAPKLTPAPDWGVSELTHAVLTYASIPAEKRTAKQSNALAIDLATLSKDLGSGSAAAWAVNQAAGYQLLPIADPALVRASTAPVAGAGPAPTLAQPIPTPALVQPVTAPAPAPVATYDALGLAALAIVAVAILILVLTE